MDVACPGVSVDRVICRCGDKGLSYSELVVASSRPFDLDRSPDGVSFEPLPDGFRIRAKCRGPLAAKGVIVVLVLTAVTLFCMVRSPNVWVVIMPAVAIVASSPFWVLALFGRIEVMRRGDRLSVFIGVGSLGLTWVYRWSAFRGAHIGLFGYRAIRSIVLDGDRSVELGPDLPHNRQVYVCRALQTLLAASSPPPPEDPSAVHCPICGARLDNSACRVCARPARIREQATVAIVSVALLLFGVAAHSYVVRHSSLWMIEGLLGLALLFYACLRQFGVKAP